MHHFWNLIMIILMIVLSGSKSHIVVIPINTLFSINATARMSHIAAPLEALFICIAMLIFFFFLVSLVTLQSNKRY